MHFLFPSFTRVRVYLLNQLTIRINILIQSSFCTVRYRRETGELWKALGKHWTFEQFNKRKKKTGRPSTPAAFIPAIRNSCSFSYQLITFRWHSSFIFHFHWNGIRSEWHRIRVDGFLAHFQFTKPVPKHTHTSSVIRIIWWPHVWHDGLCVSVIVWRQIQ